MAHLILMVFTVASFLLQVTQNIPVHSANRNQYHHRIRRVLHLNDIIKRFKRGPSESGIKLAHQSDDTIAQSGVINRKMARENLWGDLPVKKDQRRGVHIEIGIHTPRPYHRWGNLENEIENLPRKFENVANLRHRLRWGNLERVIDDQPKKLESVVEEAAVDTTDLSEMEKLCADCNRKMMEVRPAFPCDDWENHTNTCFLDRNIGDTVTFVLSLAGSEGEAHKVVWEQEFHMMNAQDKTKVLIDPDNPPWNMMIGSQGREMRISPITEMDVDFNRFSATAAGLGGPISANKIYFQIRVVPFDLGFVYPGEIITLNIRSYMTLPYESLKIRWYLENEGESSTLPSNMKCSPTCETLFISELRREQEGVLACTIYTNKGFMATKKRFLMQEMGDNSDVLLTIRKRTHGNEEPHERDSRQTEKNTRHPLNINKLVNEVDSPIFQAPVRRRQITVSERRPTSEDMLKGSPLLSRSFNNVMGNLASQQNGASEPNMLLKNLNQMSQDDILSKNGHTFINERPLESRLSNNGVGNFANQQNVAPVLNGPVESINQYSNDEIVRKNGQIGINEGYVDQGELQQPSVVDMPAGKKTVIGSGLAEGVILNIEKIPPNIEVIAEDKLSQMVSFCFKDTQCSVAATCVRDNSKTPGFCRCLPLHSGNGLFCYEDSEGSMRLRGETIPQETKVDVA